MMNGFIKKAILSVGGAGALMMVVGCHHEKTCHFDELVDPCYPDRYMCAARRCVNDSMAPQVQNGHVLDQTIWEHHFLPNTATLTNGGKIHLDYLLRRRPHPDTMVYIQTAQSIPGDPAKPADLVKMRSELDAQRVTAVQNYLNTLGAARGATFQVAVHDPSDPSISAIPAGQMIIQMYGSSSGTVFGTGGGTGISATSGGGGGGGGGGVRPGGSGAGAGPAGAGAGSGGSMGGY